MKNNNIFDVGALMDWTDWLSVTKLNIQFTHLKLIPF